MRRTLAHLHLLRREISTARSLRPCPAAHSLSRWCSTQAMLSSTITTTTTSSLLPSATALASALREQLFAQGSNTITTAAAATTHGMSRRALEAQALHTLLPLTDTTYDSDTEGKAAAQRFAEAWRALSTMHYMVADTTTTTTSNSSSNDDTSADEMVYACDWARVLTTVAMTEMPYEGMHEDDFIVRLRTHCPGLPDRAGLAHALSGATSLAAWLQHHFAHLFLITRSAVTHEPIYYAARCNNVSPAYGHTEANAKEEGAASGPALRAEEHNALCALTHALRLLGGGKAGPTWYDVPSVTSLVSPALCPHGHSWASFLLQPHIQQAAMELRTEVRVRAVRAAVPTHYFILDATSLTSFAAGEGGEEEKEKEREEMLRAHGFAHDGSCALKILHRSSQLRPQLAGSKADDATAAGAASSAAKTEYVVVDDILDAEHVCAALLAKLSRNTSHDLPDSSSSTAKDDDDGAGMAEQTGVRAQPLRVTVLCAEDKREAFARMLHDLPRQSRLQIELCTPGKQA